MTLRLNGSTSGYVEIDAPAAAGSNTLILPTGNGSNGQVLSTNGSGALSFVDRMTAAGPAFHVTKNNIQSVSNNVWTKIQFDDETFDTNSAYDSSTNYRFQPTVAGYYQINIDLNSSSSDLLVGIWKNGSEYVRGRNNFQQASVSQLVYLNGSTDYVEPYGYVTSTGAFSSGGSVENQFSGFLARHA
jgi:hypothetical protein